MFDLDEPNPDQVEETELDWSLILQNDYLVIRFGIRIVYFDMKTLKIVDKKRKKKKGETKEREERSYVAKKV